MVDLTKILKLSEDIAVQIIKGTFVGPILIAVSPAGLMSLSILDPKMSRMDSEKKGASQAEEIADRAVDQILDYSSGRLRAFTLPLDFSLATNFQRKVLDVTAQIPFGEVLTYGGVAERIGKPKAARAVGGALGRNPIGIVVPCHRVVAHNGHLHGFSSHTGIQMKAKLLRHEGVQLQDDSVPLER